jgi:integrase
MTLYRREGTKNWWIRLEKGGRVVQRSAKTTSKREARDIEAAMRVEIGSALPEGAKPQTLLEFTRLLYPYWTRTAKRVRTAVFYKSAFIHLCQFPPLANARLHEIKPALVEKFVQHRLSQKASIVRTNQSIRALRRALHLAVKWELLNRAPRLEMAGAEPKRDYVVSEADFQRLLAATPKPERMVGCFKVAADDGKLMKAILTTLYDCGLRAGEAMALRWDDVNLEGKWLFVRAGKTKNAVRRVPLTSRVVAALETLPKAGETVFAHRGKQITVGAVSHDFTKLRRQLGLPDGCVLHSLRHSYATRLGNKGANVLDLQTICGWSSPVIAARYVHLDEDRMETVRNLLEPAREKA